MLQWGENRQEQRVARMCAGMQLYAPSQSASTPHVHAPAPSRHAGAAYGDFETLAPWPNRWLSTLLALHRCKTGVRRV